MNDFSALGENLKAIRDKRGLNLNDVSELTGISKAMLSKIERGESVPTITTVWKIANGLKITLNALAGDGENNYTVKDIATMTPLIDEGGLFSLYNVFPFSPLDGVQVFYGVLSLDIITRPPCLSTKVQRRSIALYSRGNWTW